MALVNCPTCRKKFDPQQSGAMPFCSDRCRQIDLGRWLNEGISIPVRNDDESGDSSAASDAVEDDA